MNYNPNFAPNGAPMPNGAPTQGMPNQPTTGGYTQPNFGYQPQQPAPSYAGTTANGKVAPQEGDVRYIDNDDNVVRITDRIMGVTRLANYGDNSKPTIVVLQLSVSRSNQNSERTFSNFVTLMGPQADRAIQHLSIGDRISITGEIRNNAYEKNGEKKFSIDIIASSWRFAETTASKEYRLWKKQIDAQFANKPYVAPESLLENFNHKQARKQAQAQTQQPVYQAPTGMGYNM